MPTTGLHLCMETERLCFSKTTLAANVKPYMTVSRLLQYSSIQRQLCWLRIYIIVLGLGTIIVSVLLRQFHSAHVTPHTNHVQITIHVVCNSYSVSGMALQLPKCGRQHYRKVCSLQYGVNSAVSGRNNCGPQHWGPEKNSWQYKNQFGPTTIHHDILWPIREKLCQNRKHWTPTRTAGRESLDGWLCQKRHWSRSE